MYKDLDRRQNVGHFFCLLDIDAFIDPAEFKRRIDGMIDQIKSCGKRPGVEEILVPGERSARRMMENLKAGVQLDPATINELRGLCNELGVRFALPAAA
jgi:LDH2 family malate/lactate/ureidoglycolate dehydrogenase